MTDEYDVLDSTLETIVSMKSLLHDYKYILDALKTERDELKRDNERLKNEYTQMREQNTLLLKEIEELEYKQKRNSKGQFVKK